MHLPTYRQSLDASSTKPLQILLITFPSATISRNLKPQKLIKLSECPSLCCDFVLTPIAIVQLTLDCHDLERATGYDFDTQAIVPNFVVRHLTLKFPYVLKLRTIYTNLDLSLDICIHNSNTNNSISHSFLEQIPQVVSLPVDVIEIHVRRQHEDPRLRYGALNKIIHMLAPKTQGFETSWLIS